MKTTCFALAFLIGGIVTAGAQTPKIFHYSHSGSPQSLKTSNGQNFGIVHPHNIEIKKLDTIQPVNNTTPKPTFSNARSADSVNKKNPPVKPKTPAQPVTPKKK